MDGNRITARAVNSTAIPGQGGFDLRELKWLRGAVAENEFLDVFPAHLVVEAIDDGRINTNLVEEQAPNSEQVADENADGEIERRPARNSSEEAASFLVHFAWRPIRIPR
jgi:hypothetical protein